MIVSILLYIIFGLAFYAIGNADRLASIKMGMKGRRLTPYSWAFILLFTLISGLRYNLGADCESYVESFEKGDFIEILEKREYLFAYITMGLKDIDMGRVVFLGFWAFIEIFFFYKSLSNRKYLLPMIGLVMMLGPFYYDMQNGIRQIVAACIFTFAVQQKIDNNRWKQYVILIFVAALIHRSALILLVFVFLPNKDYFNHRYLVIAGLFVSVFLGQQGWLLQYLNAGAALISPEEAMGYEGYIGRMEYFTEQIGHTMGYGPRRIVLLVVSLSIVWFYPAMQKRYNDKFLMFCFSGFVIYAIFAENLLTAAHSSLSRPFLYFKLFKLICNAYLLVYLKEKYGRRNPLLYYMVLFFTIIYMPMDNVAVANDKNATTLFKFIFMKP